MLYRQTPYIEVIADGSDDIVLKVISDRLQLRLYNLQQNCHKRQPLALTS